MEQDREQYETELYEDPQEEIAERERHLQRMKRIEEMKREKQRALRMQKLTLAGAAVLLVAAGFGIGALIRAGLSGGDGKTNPKSYMQAQQDSEDPSDSETAGGISSFLQGGDFGELRDHLEQETDQTSPGGETSPGQEPEGNAEPPGKGTVENPGGTDQDEPAFTAASTSVTLGFDPEIVSEYGVLIDVEKQEILAGREYASRISPASMTKILTVLTAADALGIKDGTEEVLNDTFTMTIEITDYTYVNECSIAGFEVGEEIPVRDLFYGTILPSGADAAVGLATYVAGSHEAFVELMNEKLKQMGLSETTHFTNCVGLYDESHYSTVYDIAVILKEAADNPFCREILSAHTYELAATEQHPDGILLSNWFLRRIEDRDTHGVVLCGKTGYVTQSGSCAASLSADKDGREYLCVTAGSTSSKQCINDQRMLYEKFLPSPDSV